MIDEYVPPSPTVQVQQHPHVSAPDGQCVRQSVALGPEKSTIDSFVSLHRAEGFGLSIAEAMAYGKPVIATNWSGNIDFMEGEILVRHQPVKPRLFQGDVVIIVHIIDADDLIAAR